MRISALRARCCTYFREASSRCCRTHTTSASWCSLVVWAMMVCMMNKAGGSAAFGRWAQTHIKSRVGAQLATVALGCLIFIDDYFNCLTVGSVMRPVTDKHRVSRAKLAYIIDATAAPVCTLQPISSRAAVAVSGFVSDGKGLSLFIRAIPYNFYALFTIAMMVMLVVLRVDYGPMAKSGRWPARETCSAAGRTPMRAQGRPRRTKGVWLTLLHPLQCLFSAAWWAWCIPAASSHAGKAACWRVSAPRSQTPTRR